MVRHGRGPRRHPHPPRAPGRGQGSRLTRPRLRHDQHRRQTDGAPPCPSLAPVPRALKLKRQPITTSFPSGHSASAAAFATGVALESRGWGAAVAPLATAVALSRVYTGAHFPSDVLAGAALGAAAAYAVRGMLPQHGPRH
ncbi:phosphatase PAP2 family protein [Streptomyces sp. RPA4-2]|uniref:phosphatase PAP2 family protein n=1 Tax=Streptomyces sp. RPA4-2 TaxID=2721244 RepID=UPI0034E8B7FB